MRGYVPVFYDWTEVTGELNDQEKGRLIDAIVLYAQGGDWQDRIKGNERYLFPAFKGQIDRANEISAVRAKAGSEGGKAKQAPESKPEQTEAKPVKRFEKPTVEQVREYCKNRKNGIDAEQFVAFYESKGWKVGSSPMKDWKQAVITWEKRNRASSQTKKVVAQEYDQRDYSDKDKKMQDRFWQATEGIL